MKKPHYGSEVTWRWKATKRLQIDFTSQNNGTKTLHISLASHMHASAIPCQCRLLSCILNIYTPTHHSRPHYATRLPSLPSAYYHVHKRARRSTRSSRINCSNRRAIQFSVFYIAQYHKLRICLRGLYNLYTYDIPCPRTSHRIRKNSLKK